MSAHRQCRHNANGLTLPVLTTDIGDELRRISWTAKPTTFRPSFHFYPRYMMSPAIFAAKARSCSKNPLTCSRPPLYFSDFRGFK